jgi:hypothetical protein
MKHWISQWMHMSKMRSEFVRDIVSNIFTNVERYSFGYEFGSEEMKRRSAEFKGKGKLGGKIFQFENFETKEYWNSLEELTKNFLTKEWVVYLSQKKNFITSDNPGFSFTYSSQNQLLKYSPVFGDYNTSMDKFVVHFYPLTSKMCLCLKPFTWRDDSTEEQISNDINKVIQFESITDDMTESINDCTQHTSYKMVIGNLKSDVERYTKK